MDGRGGRRLLKGLDDEAEESLTLLNNVEMSIEEDEYDIELLPQHTTLMVPRQ